MFEQIEIIGNLGQDPELNYTNNGDPVCNLNVAVNNRYTSNGEDIEETNWYRVSVWDNSADACNQYLQTGSKVFVQGRPSISVFERNNGDWDGQIEIRAFTVKFLDPAPGNGQNNRQNNGGNNRNNRNNQRNQRNNQRGQRQQARRQDYAPAQDDSDDDIPWD